MVQVTPPSDSTASTELFTDAPTEAFAASGTLRLKAIAWSLAAAAMCGTLITAAVFSRSNSASHGNSASQAEAGSAVSETVAPATAVDAPEEAPISPTDTEAKSPGVATPGLENAQSETAAGVEATSETAVQQPQEQITEPSLKNSARVETVTDNGSADAKQPTTPRFDPLDLDPEGFDLSSLRRKGRMPPVEQKSPPPTEQPQIPSADREPPHAALPKSTIKINTQVVRRSPERTHGTSLPAASEQLALELPAVEIDRMPLYAFLDLVSQLGNVPISLSPEHLQMAAVSAHAPVSVDRKQATIGEILHDALQPLHLDYRAEGPHVVILRPDAEKRREIEYPIDDLISSDAVIPKATIPKAATSKTATSKEGAEQLADWIKHLIAPSRWQSAGGDGLLRVDAGTTLRIEQTQRVQYEVLCFLERLRIARKLAPRSRYPAERLSILSAGGAFAGKLNKPVTFTFSRYTPLQEIFVYWGQQLDVAILVDWPALMAGQSGPQTRIACSVTDQPWHAALDAVLSPIGLAWRRIDDETLQITTSQVASSEPQLEFYALESFGIKGGVDLIAELQGQIDQQRAAAISPSDAILMIDLKSNILLARQPAVIQRLIMLRLQRHGEN